MQSNRPGALWVGLIVLALVIVLNVLIGLGSGSAVLLVSGALNAALWWGLFSGHRWAYVVTLVFASINVIYALGQDEFVVILGMILGNLAVALPVWLAHDYFWGARRADMARPNFCGRCGSGLPPDDRAACPSCGAPLRPAASAGQAGTRE